MFGDVNVRQQENDGVRDVFELANSLILVEEQVFLYQCGIEFEDIFGILYHASNFELLI